jgi:hypothetical protein
LALAELDASEKNLPPPIQVALLVDVELLVTRSPNPNWLIYDLRSQA